ncbi:MULTISPECIES: hypothetical protein [Mesorhizobium]|uniref:hypothetical protein n=1 Tax=Mesorhizobium TaxID=68287 RepID=UPI001FCECDC9|nr:MULTISPECIES: hypothetical protein [Mesorhizobium]
MADDKCNRGSGAETASRVTKNMSSAISPLSSASQYRRIRDLFGKHGNDRETLCREAQRLGTP